MNEELNLEEFNFNACYKENRLIIFENSNYMDLIEAEMLYDWLGKLLRKKKGKEKNKMASKKKIVAVKPSPKKTTKKKK